MAKRKTGVDPNAEAKALVEGEDQYQSAEGTDPTAPDPGPKMRWQVQAEEAEARAKRAREEVAQERLAKQKAALDFVKGEAKVEGKSEDWKVDANGRYIEGPHKGSKKSRVEAEAYIEKLKETELPATAPQPIVLPPGKYEPMPQVEPQGDCCAVCRFGAAEEKGGRLFIHCRRHPPMSVLTNLQRNEQGMIIGSEIFSFFPVMQPGAWCGDFEEGEPGIILPGLATKAQ